MKERPILFSAPMVKALLAGTKTQTRRLIKREGAPLQLKHSSHYLQPMYGVSPPPDPVQFGERGLWREVGPDYPDADDDDVRCPFGAPGDRLWVKETWTQIRGNGIRTWYRADGEPRDSAGDIIPTRAHEPRWAPSIHMRRSQSRITLEVTSVRVERLQSISEEDAKAEGVEPPSYSETWLCIPKGTGGPYERFVEPDAEERAQLEHVKHQPARSMWDHRPEFELLWNKINGERASWASNPWVWVVSFRRLP